MVVLTKRHPRPHRPILFNVRRALTTVLTSVVTCVALGVTVATPSAGARAASADPADPPTTVDGWTTTTPAAAGFDEHRLRRLANGARLDGSSCFAVVRDGKLVGDWSWATPRTTPREVFSVTKSFTSALVGIAVRDGDLGLDDRVSRYVPQWRGTPSAGVTVRDLLSNDSGRYWSMTSDYVRLSKARDRSSYAVGLRQQFRPGRAWAYNNAAIQVLDRVISTATGVPTDQLAADRLFAPLGMTHTRMTRDPSGLSTNTYVNAQSTCLDLARFDQLYLLGGVTPDGERLLDPAFVRASVGRSSTKLNAAYGFLWWLNRPGVLRGPTDAVDRQGQPLEVHRGQLVPGAPRTLYSAIGFAGQIGMVDPGSRTIVVRLGPASAGSSYGFDDAARVVTWALRR